MIKTIEYYLVNSCWNYQCFKFLLVALIKKKGFLLVAILLYSMCCMDDAVLGIVVDSKADVSPSEVLQCHVSVTIMNFLLLV